MMHYKSNEFVWFYIFVMSYFSIPHTNGINKNYFKIFPKIGENVTLKCGNSNMKISNVLWQMNHKELPGRAKVLENGDLFILSFDTADAGIYICDLATARDYVGHAPLTEFELKTRNVPGSLLDVRVIPNTVLMLITWKEVESYDEFPIINITIRYRNIGDRTPVGNWNILKVDPFKVQKEIYSLHSNTIYEIQIWASNEIGDGAKTELTTKTLSEMTEIDSEKRLLEGIDTFDTRAWTFAVIVIMSTFSIFGVALCYLIIKDPRMQKGLENSDDIERIELIPNITINPGYFET